MRVEDCELVGRTLQGDHTAFAELVDRYRDAASGVAYHHLGNFEDVRDAVQEAFVRAYLRLSQLQDPMKFGAWLRAITSNVCTDTLRRSANSEIPLDSLGEHAGPEHPGCDARRLAARALVEDALRRLSDKTRLTVTLAYVDGYTHQEVADFLEVPVNTVRSRLQHAKKQLREEMMNMVADVLDEGKPDRDFTLQVVEEALRRATDARASHATGAALEHYDEALGALDRLDDDAEVRRRRMDVLWLKGLATWFPHGHDEAIRLFEESLAIAEKLGDRAGRAAKLQHLGVTHTNQTEEAQQYYRMALDAYEELGDAAGQGMCLQWLGGQSFFASRVAEAVDYYTRAMPLLAEADRHDWLAVCRALLDLVAEVGEERASELRAFGAGCTVLEKKDGIVRLAQQPGISRGLYRDDVPMLPVHSPFWHIAHLRKFLDAAIPVGGSWSGDAFSYSLQPLQGTVTVKSASESVTMPAGTFENCLLTEQVTTEGDLPDDGPEKKKELNRMVFCGIRRAWFAPGVGLVRIHVHRGDDAEATSQLTDFAVDDQPEDYLPLAAGNSWTYGWADLPDDWTAKEVYKVTANDGDLWYLEHYSYAYKDDCTSQEEES